MRDRWSYATAIELEQPFEGMTVSEFILQGDTVTLLDEGLSRFDFARCFSRGGR
jgi:hypothetical protein